MSDEESKLDPATEDLGDQQVGSLSDELRKLGVALGRLEQSGSAGASSGEESEDRCGHEQSASDSSAAPKPESAPGACRFCPMCQVIALARGQRSDALETLVGAASGLVSALTKFVDQSAQQRAAQSADGEAPTASRLERIDLE